VKNEATPKRQIKVSIHPRHMNQGLNSDILYEQIGKASVVSYLLHLIRAILPDNS
jgi:hypothetical protein